MNIIIPEFKILEMSYYLLGKAIFKTCIKQKVPPTIFNEFYNSRKCSDAFRLKYCDGLTVEKIAEQTSYDVRSIYKQLDGDMSTFGRWLVHDSVESKTFESMRDSIESAIKTEYKERNICNTDNRAWKQLRSDCLKALS